MNRTEALQLIRSGANFANRDLTGVNLRGVNFAYLDLRGVNFTGCDFTLANFTDVDFHGTNFTNANLRGAGLWGANFTNAVLLRANFTNANLRGTKGNGREIKNIDTPTYSVAYTRDRLQIGCENHSFEEWWAFTYDAIGEMDDGALEYWREYKNLIRKTIEEDPAL